MTISLGNFNVISDGILNSLLKVQGGPGVNTITPSLLVDDGSSLKYNGVPIGGAAIVPAASFYVDGTYTGTSTGAQETPFKTISAALAACSGTGPYSIFVAGGSYADAGPIVGGAAQIEIYGNNATWTVAGGVTLNGPATVYDLNTVGAVTYAYTGSVRSERHGGSITGGNVVIYGFVHWYGVQSSASGGGYTVTVFGTLAGDFVTGGTEYLSGGTSALIAMNNINLQRSSGYNFDMTAGGQIALNGGFLTTAAGTYNIYLPTANTAATSHAVQGITFIAGLGLSAGASTYYVYDNLSLDPVGVLGYAFYRVGSTSSHPISNQYVTNTASVASVAATYKSGTTGSVTLDSGTTGAVNVGTGANIKTTTIGNSTSGSKVKIYGEIDGVAAAAGYIRLAITSTIVSGSARSQTTATPANVTSIALTAGDWDLQGQVTYIATSVTSAAGALWEAGINTTTATLPTDGSEAYEPIMNAVTTTTFKQTINISRKIVNSSAATTQYLAAEATFTAGTVTAYGSITARRVH